MSTAHFYRNISALRLPIEEVLQHHNFCDVPSDWSIIIADVQNSTAAVAAGKHNDVNLVAAGSIIACLNIAKARSIEIPFFFGGDGCTILVPGELTEEVHAALVQHNDNAMRTVGLSMHIGCVSIAKVVESGAHVRIAKVQLGESLSKAIFLGNGLKVAEQQVKLATLREVAESNPANVPNMEGLECRWDKVKPPEGENEIVCYLIEAIDQQHQASIYRSVMMKLDELYGTIETRSPLSLNRLKWLVSFQKIEKEMFMRYGRWKFRYYLMALLQNILGIFYFKYDLRLGAAVTGKTYLAQVIANADTLTIDGRINTIISGKREKRTVFIEFLKKLEADRQIIFGHHISKESVMTCYIENMNARHIHFVDGSDGGYTEAAKELKGKLLSR